MSRQYTDARSSEIILLRRLALDKLMTLVYKLIMLVFRRTRLPARQMGVIAMRVQSYGQNLTQLTQGPSFFPINSYLVREDDGFTLVDTGWKGNAPAILAAAQAQGAPIKRILLTHAHGDHVGSLDALHAALPDAEVMISARDARLLAGDLSLEPRASRRPKYAAASSRLRPNRRGCCPPEIALARSKSSPRPDIRRGTSPISTRAIAR